MLPWATLLEAVLKLFGSIADYLGNRQLLKAGKYEAENEGLKATLETVRKADEVEEQFNINPDSNHFNSVRDKYANPPQH